MPDAAGSRVAYVKPHGALYNATVHHQAQAAAVVAGVRAFGDLPILGLPGSRLLDEAGERGVPEAFADRGYTPEGTLVSRREPGALLPDTEAVVERAVRLATRGEIVAVDGTVPENQRPVALPARRHPRRGRARPRGVGRACRGGRQSDRLRLSRVACPFRRRLRHLAE